MPMNLAVGIGCKKGKSLKEIAQAVYTTFAQNHLLIERIGVIASIDRKAQEQGIIDFCKTDEVAVPDVCGTGIRTAGGYIYGIVLCKGADGCG